MYTPCINDIPVDCKEKYYCVKKGMGGHKGAFINFIDPSKNSSKCRYIECGKKFKENDKEVVIYKKLYELANNKEIPRVFLDFFPKFHIKYCSIGNNNYFSIENLNKNLGDNVQNLDIKLGYKSAFKHNTGLIKTQRHKQINHKFSTSHDYGFRLEGTTLKKKLLTQNENNSILYDINKVDKYIRITELPINIKDLLHGKIKKKSMASLFKKKNKYDLYIIHPLIVLNIFFNNNIKNAKKMFDNIFDMLYKFILPNIKIAIELRSNVKHNKVAVGFIGSSLMLLYGDQKVASKIIDIAHPYIMEAKTDDRIRENNFKVIYNMTMGVLSFIIVLDYWIYNNDNKWINKNINSRKLITSMYTLLINDKDTILKF
jgi:hypothetical protein